MGGRIGSAFSEVRSSQSTPHLQALNVVRGQKVLQGMQSLEYF